MIANGFVFCIYMSSVSVSPSQRRGKMRWMYGSMEDDKRSEVDEY